MACRAEKTAMIFGVDAYRNEDGPGLRTAIFFKGCPLRCAWCSNPYGLSMKRQLIFNRNKCFSCGRCIENCSRNVNSLRDGVLEVDFDECRCCGLCVVSCPAGARKIAGEEYTVSKLFAEVEQHAMFFRRNSGGVSLSGGEVLLQSGFAAEFLRVCKANYIHTAIETSGYAEWEEFKEVARHCDLVFIDLKIFDSDTHKKYTGVSNHKILQNIRNLCEYAVANGGPKVIIRRVVVEGITDEDDIISAAKFIAELPGNPEVNILPYHNLGEAKYAMCGLKYGLEGKNMMHVGDALVQRTYELTAQYAPNCRVSVGGGNIGSAAD